MGEIISWLIEKITLLFEFLRDAMWAMLHWVGDQVRGIFWAMFEFAGNFVIWLLQGIPVPAWFDGANVQDVLNAIPAEVWWGLEFAQIPTGLAMVFGAYAFRFFIRRIPFIG